MELKRDYVLIIDKSGSMATRDCPNGKTRWEYCQESTFALASKMETLDPDGIDLYVFSGGFKKYYNVTSDKVGQIFKENEPSGSTALDSVLQDAIDGYFANPKNHMTIMVVTDGEPNDQEAVKKVIVGASNKLDADEQLAISFIQIGKDEGAKKYLKTLDDDLKGAKFDIVDAKTMDEIENMTLSEVLEAAIND